MESLSVKFIYYQAQFKILHWQTSKYSRHIAYGAIYDALDVLIDSFIESYQGKKGKIMFEGGNDSCEFADVQHIKISEYLSQFENFLVSELSSLLDSSKDTDLLNIKDEMLAELNKLKYLLTLE